MPVKLTADRIKGADYLRQLYRVNVPSGVTLQDTLEGPFWAHVAAKFTVGDKLELFAEDGTWYAELIVLVSSQVHAKVGVLTFKEFSAQKVKAKDTDPLFAIEWKGPNRKFAISRISDKAVIKEGFSDREGADDWLEANRSEIV
jgi:hypothetical protein